MHKGFYQAFFIIKVLENKLKVRYNKNMSYPEKYRKRVIEYREEGHTLEETHNVFKAAVSTIREWERQYREEGNLKQKIPKRPFKKIDPEKLKEYVEKHPDAYQKEIAQEFKCTQKAISKALKRLKITRKKRASVIKNKIRKK